MPYTHGKPSISDHSLLKGCPALVTDLLDVQKSPLDENHCPEGQNPNCLLDLQGPSQAEARFPLFLCFLPLHPMLLILQSHPVPLTKPGLCPKLYLPLNMASLCCDSLLQSPHLTHSSFSSDIQPACRLCTGSPDTFRDTFLSCSVHAVFVHLRILLPLLEHRNHNLFISVPP